MSVICLFNADSLRVGRFEVSVDDPRFESAGQPPRHVVAFPRTSVLLEPAGGAPFVADASTVLFYNQGTPFRRKPLSADGDRSDWFSLPADVVLAVAQNLDPSVERRPESPFRFTHAAVDAQIYAMQRALQRHLRSGEEAERLFVEETLIEILSLTLRSAYKCAPHRRPQPGARIDIVAAINEVKAIALKTLGRKWSLGELAAPVGLSAFQLCRAFRHSEGTTLFRWLAGVRLRQSLELLEHSVELVEVASTLGFSSHGHFSASFKAEYGVTPSEFRRRMK